jgi:hypothetical protein
VKKIILVVCLAAACGGGQSSKYPSRPDGCDVHVFQSAPPMNTDNIGPVSSHCDDQSFSKDDCLRTLKDQVCKLGGDVVWGVSPEPAHEDGQWKYRGRAAHTK